MSIDNSQKIIDNIFSDQELRSVTIGFQGGEPTLIGIEFFTKFFEYVDLKKGKVNVNFAIQTNGILINEQWVSVLKKYNVLVGLSLDGPAATHDSNRIDFGNKNTHQKVIYTAKVFQENDIQFNILTVVTNKSSKNIAKIYKYLTSNDFQYLQFIPCLTPLDYKVKNIRQVNELYYTYLSDLFKVWYEDLNNGKYVSVRWFDNIINMIMGAEPESCDMRGACTCQNIIEADGTTFTCDFFAVDEFIVGNALEMSFEQMVYSQVSTQFIKRSMDHPQECKSCEIYKYCRNGCTRMRIDGKYMYCEPLKRFFRNYEADLKKAAFILKRR
ncbi:SPASM domain-containing protein [Mollicutes bacterium LVI A0039]|nr:SPASM domain-containing protein [Mollicutes bacterium LVI A0039]